MKRLLLMGSLVLAVGCESRKEAADSFAATAAESLRFVEKEGLCFAVATAARGDSSDSGVGIAMVQIPCAGDRAASAAAAAAPTLSGWHDDGAAVGPVRPLNAAERDRAIQREHRR